MAKTFDFLNDFLFFFFCKKQRNFKKNKNKPQSGGKKQKNIKKKQKTKKSKKIQTMRPTPLPPPAGGRGGSHSLDFFVFCFFLSFFCFFPPDFGLFCFFLRFFFVFVTKKSLRKSKFFAKIHWFSYGFLGFSPTALAKGF